MAKTKTLMEMVDAITAQLEEIANEIDFDALGVDKEDDYRIIVCPERIFMDDYLPSEERWVESNSELPSLDIDAPMQSPYKNTLFFIVHVGSGDRNVGVSETDVSIQALSEENDFLIAREILDRFVAKYNFVYDATNNIIQAYFNPEISSSQEEVYTGFRALMSCRGFVRVPTEGVLFVTEIDADFNYNGEDYSVRLPFLNLSYQYTAQPDPQSFAGFKGKTMTLNRQSTEIVSFGTYLMYYKDGSDPSMNAFTKAILLAKGGLNQKFNIKLLTATYDESDNRLAISDDWYVLTGMGYSQELGDLSPWNLSFSMAKEKEE